MPSAGVFKKEIDLSLYTEISSDVVLAVVHTFAKGPINQRTLISNLAQLEEVFGPKPIDDDIHGQGFFALREYFRNGNQTQVVRVESAANPAHTAAMSVRGATDQSIVTDTDGVTSIPGTRTLASAGTDFVTDGVLVGDVLEVHETAADDGFYEITVVASGLLTIDRDWPTGSLSAQDFTVWTNKREAGVDGVTSVPSTRTFTSAGSTFQTNNVKAGDVLHINDPAVAVDDGDNAFYVIAVVTSETVLTLNRDLPEGSLTGLTFTVYGDMHPPAADGDTTTPKEFVSAGASFQSHLVKAGDLLIILDASTPGDDGTFLITGLKTASEETTLEIASDTFPVGGLTGLSYRIVPGSIQFDSDTKGTSFNAHTIQAVQNSVENLNFNIRITDPAGFLVEELGALSLANVAAEFLANSALFTAAPLATRLGPAVNYTALVQGGEDGTTGIVDSDLIGTTGKALQLFKNPEDVIVDILIIPGYSSQAVTDALVNLAEERSDCMAIVDPPDSPTITVNQQFIDWSNGVGSLGRTTSLNTSFGALYAPWQEIADPYFSKDRFTAPSGHAASVWAQSTNAKFQWFAPAGFKRGKVKGAQDVRISMTAQGDRDALQGNGNVNPIVKFIKEGIHVFGQKTLLKSTTALDRVNVRRMLLFLERSILSSSKLLTFEPNDATLDREFFNLVDPVLSFVKSNRGIIEYLIVSDETTSPPAVREQNKKISKIFIKPTKTAEIIEIQFILTSQSANFQELLAA